MNKYDDTDYLIEREESIEYEEKAKRQTENTINYYKNIEKIEEVPIDILRAMYKDVIAELKQDKKRIEELEEALLKVKDKNTTLFITCRNSIPKQKVKDLIKNETINISGFECIAVEDTEELLEDK